MSVVGGELGWLGQQLEVTSTRRIAGLVGVTPSKSHQRKERVQDPTPNHLSREGRGPQPVNDGVLWPFGRSRSGIRRLVQYGVNGRTPIEGLGPK